MKKTLLLFVGLMVLFTGCQKVVDAKELLNTEEQIFISSYISPQDTVLRVNVSRALPAIGTPLSISDHEANRNLFLIKNALVSLSDDLGNTAQLFYSDSLDTYLTPSSSLEILSEQTYFLEVTVDAKTFSTSCTIPKKVETINERITYRDDMYGGTEAEITLSFEDIKGADNYYVLGGIASNTVQYDNFEPETYTYPLYFDTDEFLTDNLEDGAILSGTTYSYFGTDATVIDNSIILQVANVEESLFQNLRTTATNAESEGNPFVEYAIAPNNFTEDGVIGVFAGYQITEKKIEVEY